MTSHRMGASISKPLICTQYHMVKSDPSNVPRHHDKEPMGKPTHCHRPDSKKLMDPKERKVRESTMELGSNGPVKAICWEFKP